METAHNNASVVIVNTLGQKIINQEFDGNQTMLDVKALTAGFYYLQVIQKGSLIAIASFIKK